MDVSQTSHRLLFSRRQFTTLEFALDRFLVGVSIHLHCSRLFEPQYLYNCMPSSYLPVPLTRPKTPTPNRQPLCEVVLQFASNPPSPPLCYSVSSDDDSPSIAVVTGISLSSLPFIPVAHRGTSAQLQRHRCKSLGG